MNKDQIISELKKKHADFSGYIVNLGDKDFLFSLPEKWTAGQQIDHICRAVAPVTMAFGLPVLVLKIMFGKANRPSRTFEILVEKYKKKLEEGYKASGQFMPKAVPLEQKKVLEQKLSKSVAKLCKRINGFSEKQLDTYILPHPLLGKLTLREMLYFTIFHAEHHHLLAVKYLA